MGPRILFHLAFLAAILLASMPFAADANVTRYLHLSASASCPGNILLMNATGSDGLPAYDVELRLVLYLPYQGLRALQHTDSNGLASVELTKNGSYRIYMATDAYNHEKYIEFEYPKMCPPPPPKQMDVSVSADCDALRLNISVAKNETGAPLDGVFIIAGNWSSFTGESGEVSVPFEKGYVYIIAERGNYSKQEFYFDAHCLPPPECLNDSDCDGFEFCGIGGDCENVSGACGYPENHTWVAYGCCEDADCGNESFFCENNTCIGKPLPPEPPEANITNLTNATNAGNATDITNMTNQPDATGTKNAGAGEGFTAVAYAALAVILIIVLYLGWKRIRPSSPS